MRIVYMLAMHDVLRYGELKKLLTPITHKVLTTQLKELEKDGLINRKEYQQIPLRVEYSLTDMGKDLEPLVQKCTSGYSNIIFSSKRRCSRNGLKIIEQSPPSGKIV